MASQSTGRDDNANDLDRRFPDVSDGPGASDANNGGGAGSGIPDAETALRTGDTATRGDVEKDREKLFPESTPRREVPGDTDENLRRAD